MQNQDLFVKYHWRQAIMLFIVVILVVSLDVIIKDTDLFKKDKGLVKGEFIISDHQQDYKDIIIAYQNNIKNTVQDYLKQRSAYTTENQEWLFLINSTRNKLLNTNIPDSYSELHLKLITTLDIEKEAVTEGDQDKMNQVNIRWQEILDQYYWIEY